MRFFAKSTLVWMLATAGASLIHADDQVGVSGSAQSPAPVSTGIQLPLAEMLVRAPGLKESVVTDTRHVMHLQQMARKEKDVIKLNCINDKLVQIKPQSNIADRAVNTLEGLDSNDESRHGVYDELTRAVEAVRHLREEADQCAGEPTIAAESSNTWTGPDVPDNPFTDPFDSGIEPPAYASPYN